MQPDWIPHWLSLILNWIHEEQTLVAGMLALIGAYATVQIIRQQINTQKEQWDNERDRRHLANRARLPLALSEIVDYSLRAYSICRHIFYIYSSATRESNTPDPPQLPERALEVLATAIENATQEDLRNALIEILSEIQVMHSRLTGSLGSFPAARHIGGLNNRDAFAYRAFEAELMRARTERLFEYARNVENRVSILRNKKDAEECFTFGKPQEEFENKVAEYIRAYWPESADQDKVTSNHAAR